MTSSDLLAILLYINGGFTVYYLAALTEEDLKGTIAGACIGLMWPLIMPIALSIKLAKHYRQRKSDADIH